MIEKHNKGKIYHGRVITNIDGSDYWVFKLWKYIHRYSRSNNVSIFSEWKSEENSLTGYYVFYDYIRRSNIEEGSHIFRKDESSGFNPFNCYFEKKYNSSESNI